MRLPGQSPFELDFEDRDELSQEQLIPQPSDEYFEEIRKFGEAERAQMQKDDQNQKLLQKFGPQKQTQPGVRDLTRDLSSMQPTELEQDLTKPQELGDVQLRQAQDIANQNLRDARTNLAANQILSGATQFNQGKFEEETPFVKNLLESANRPVEQLLTQRKSEAERLDFTNKQKLLDPNSEESKRARELIRQNFPDFASSPSFERMTAQQLDDNFKVLQLKEQLDARKETARSAAADRALRQQELLAQRKLEEDRKGRQYATERTAKFQDGVNKSLEKLNEQITKGEQIDVIAEKAKTNPMSAAQLGVSVAKAMGEVGALSEADVTRYVANKALVPRVTQYLTSLSKGTLTEENAELVKESLKVLTDMAKDRRNVIIRNRARQFSRNMSESLDRPYSVNDTLILLGQDDLADFEDPTLESVQTIAKAREEAQARAKERKDSAQKAATLTSAVKFRQKQKDGKIALFDENKKFIGFEE